MFGASNPTTSSQPGNLNWTFCHQPSDTMHHPFTTVPKHQPCCRGQSFYSNGVPKSGGDIVLEWTFHTPNTQPHPSGNGIFIYQHWPMKPPPPPLSPPRQARKHFHTSSVWDMTSSDLLVAEAIGCWLTPPSKLYYRSSYWAVYYAIPCSSGLWWLVKASP